MLRRLQSRHEIDLPYGKWGRAKPILFVIATLAVLFVILPFLVSPLAAASESVRRAAVLIGAGVGTLLLVLLVTGLRGKPGWQR